MKVSIDFIKGYLSNSGGTTYAIVCNDVSRTLVEDGIYYVFYSDGKITSKFPIHNIAKITEVKE